jgi:hypothetical protein
MSLQLLERYETEARRVREGHRIKHEEEQVEEREKREHLSTKHAEAAPETPTSHGGKTYTPEGIEGLAPGLEQAAKSAAGNEGLEATLKASVSPAGEASAEVGQGIQTGIEKGGAAINKAIGSWTSELAKILKDLTSPSFWLRILKGLLGFALIILAVWLFAKAATQGKADRTTSRTQRLPTSGPGILTRLAEHKHTKQTRVSESQRRRTQRARERERQRTSPSTSTTRTGSSYT